MNQKQKHGIVLTVSITLILIGTLLSIPLAPPGIASFTTSSCETSSNTIKISSATATITTVSTVTKCMTLSVEGRIGYVGCSNTEDSVAGYNHVSTTKLFWLPYSTGGGTMEKWAAPNSIYWQNYDQQLVNYGQPSKVWVQVCEKNDRPFNLTSVVSALQILRSKSPNAKIYISGLNTYNPTTGLCNWADWQGSINLANKAVQNGIALAGPQLGPLTSSTVLIDGCHPNAPGEIILGNQLTQFFG